jgi:hypothetical protein
MPHFKVGIQNTKRVKKKKCILNVEYYDKIPRRSRIRSQAFLL